MARKVGLSDSEAQDVVQETIITVAGKMPEFNYDPAVGSFRGWLMLITRNKVTDHLRKKVYRHDGVTITREIPLDTQLLENQPDAQGLNWEETWNQEWDRHLFDEALAKVKQRISPDQYQMFYLHALKGLSARVAAKRLGVKMTDVYVAKYKVTLLLKKEIAALEKTMR
jgi:RNA polymerase sigma-70 factor (ECF subfamily)